MYLLYPVAYAPSQWVLACVILGMEIKMQYIYYLLPIKIKAKTSGKRQRERERERERERKKDRNKFQISWVLSFDPGPN